MEGTLFYLHLSICIGRAFSSHSRGSFIAFRFRGVFIQVLNEDVHYLGREELMTEILYVKIKSSYTCRVGTFRDKNI
jgi:hypothetical protein